MWWIAYEYHEYDDNGHASVCKEFIDIHPFLWAKRHSGHMSPYTLLSFQKLTEEDVAAAKEAGLIT